MQKYLLGLALVVASGAYIAFTTPDDEASAVVAPTISQPIAAIPTPITGAASPPPTQNTPSAPIPNPPPAPKSAGQYKDGSYIGSVADAYYGLVQVKASVLGGKLTNVVFLQYPNDRSTSREINSQAMPYLTQEAIAAQSANVDIVSGATDTSAAFRQSLASALLQAKS